MKLIYDRYCIRKVFIDVVLIRRIHIGYDVLHTETLFFWYISKVVFSYFISSADYHINRFTCEEILNNKSIFVSAYAKVNLIDT